MKLNNLEKIEKDIFEDKRAKLVLFFPFKIFTKIKIESFYISKTQKLSSRRRFF
ncbi:MAG: hypothetical protein GDA46_03285 [Bdellovibrionales bacterium]|nr:hypothetical protein [Bdellovibrionales bacterium]